MLRPNVHTRFSGAARRTLALALLPAAMLLFANPASAGDEGQRKVQIKVITEDGGDPVELDLSDLMVGETRWVTTDSGKDVGITREENGYRLDIDGEETFVMSPGDGMHNRVMVHSLAGEHGEGMHEAMSNVWVTGDRQVIELDGLASDNVFISGLGDLDENQRAAIIDALRAAGVDKEIHFAQAGGPHVMSFTTSSEGTIDVDGDATVDVQVLRKSLGDGEGQDGNHVILIEKKVVGGDEDDD